MNRRVLWVVPIGVVLAGAGLFALGGGLPALGPASPGASAASATASGSPAAVGTGTGPPSAPTPSQVQNASPAPTCVEVDQWVAVRASAPDTGFPVPVEWIGLGPAGDVFFTLSDVSPTIPITPAGPAALAVGLSYMTGGDRFAFTASSVTLAYDLVSGRVTGDVRTGFGKNSNRATTDASPARFDGTLTRASGAGGIGMLSGSIAHAVRTFEFRIEMTEKPIRVASGPGCPSARPTDTL